ncbi:MAG: nuclear transport factor 2 family protein [Candidatus Abyssobacteria bacterium SURF_17]|uniref:Nuclear transport factor 2 family protein n=1 Tax=Candidatus Abyssobacteria bacterium SURF_17 TaxID=2093361 RepID=A0A419F7F8_9BACT|nr:MAG: nuclear transport factor 2 family protein [Candidatus Abyssubacteria bacterium SURF_17]
MGADLEKRIQVLEDIEAIRKLKALYCYLVDAAVAGDVSKWDELLEHFTVDAWADFELLGRYEGIENVSKLFKEVVASLLSYSAHMVSNPIIEVNGTEARGRWYVHVPLTGKAENMAGWLQGRYDEEYVKINGKWKWKSMTTTFDFITPYDDGWVKTRMASI